VDQDKESKKHAVTLTPETITDSDMLEIGARFVNIAQKYHMVIESCAEKNDLSAEDR